MLAAKPGRELFFKFDQVFLHYVGAARENIGKNCLIFMTPLREEGRIIKKWNFAFAQEPDPSFSIK
jgi:hypothetical protein